MDTSSAIETPLTLENHKVQLKSPRPVWVEFCLHFFCFGLYTNIWLVGKIREFKRIHNESYTPWLWFFVPFVPLANLIALPKFVRSLNKLEDEAKVERWNAWKGFWVFGIFVLSVLFNISNHYELKQWMLVLILLVWAAFFCVANHRINAAKIKIERFEFKPNRFIFSVLEMVLLVLGVPLMLFIIYLSLTTEIFVPGKSYTSTDVFKSENSGYKFSIVGDGWRQVAIGTHSNGDAEVEFSGPLQDMYVLVFSPVQGSAVSSLAYNRLSTYDTSYNCKHEHEFNKKGTGVTARVTCTSTSVGDPAVDLSTFIETDKGVVEMYGHLSSPKNTFAKYKVGFTKMVEGFEPL